MIKLWKLVVILFVGMQSAGSAIAQDETEVSLPLDCYDIPFRDDQLCVAATASSLNAVDDIVFYKRSKEGWLTYLDARKGDIAVIYISGFSLGGKYMIVGEAEEGHPSYFIYESDDFLNPETKPRIVGSISDYFLERIVSLDDDGIAMLEYRRDLSGDDSESDCTSECYIPVNLLAGDIRD